ncbi:restriction endonuclease subunit S, partial [Bifidobacterium animalis]
LIAAEKRTLNLLKDKKTALLRQIFNQETRFKSYDRPWEQRKLGEIAEVVGGGTPDTNNPSYWNGSINWFTPAEIGSSTYVADSKRKITEKGLQHSSASLLPAYRTILFTSRASIGLVAILTTDACTNQGFQSLVASDQVDVFFLYSLCDRIKRQAVRNAAGSTFLEVSGKQLAKIPVQVPSLAEQRRIGELFQVIDALIAAKSQKIDLLELKKKSLLQQMFV